MQEIRASTIRLTQEDDNDNDNDNNDNDNDNNNNNDNDYNDNDNNDDDNNDNDNNDNNNNNKQHYLKDPPLLLNLVWFGKFRSGLGLNGMVQLYFLDVVPLKIMSSWIKKHWVMAKLRTFGMVWYGQVWFVWF